MRYVKCDKCRRKAIGQISIGKLCKIHWAEVNGDKLFLEEIREIIKRK